GSATRVIGFAAGALTGEPAPRQVALDGGLPIEQVPYALAVARCDYQRRGFAVSTYVFNETAGWARASCPPTSAGAVPTTPGANLPGLRVRHLPVRAEGASCVGAFDACAPGLLCNGSVCAWPG